MTAWDDPVMEMMEKTVKTACWLIMLGLVIVTIVPANERPVSGLSHDWEHFIAFGLAGLMFGFAYAGHFRVLCVSAVVFALILELSQIPLMTRHASVEDFVVDATAACLGIAIAHAFRMLDAFQRVTPHKS
jgi:VanZ family protein